MSGFELIEHTADEGLRLWAPSLDALFAQAAVALVAVMGTPRSAEPRRARVHLEAPDLGALLVDWLSEILYLFEAKDLATMEADVTVVRGPGSVRGPARLAATVRGVGTDGFEVSGPAIKAVTYHGLWLEETPRGWEAVVYLDV